MATIKNGKKGAVSRPVTANVAPTEDYKAIEYIEDVKKVIDYIKEKTNNYDISLLKLDSFNVNIINEIFKRLYNDIKESCNVKDADIKDQNAAYKYNVCKLLYTKRLKTTQSSKENFLPSIIGLLEIDLFKYDDDSNTLIILTAKINKESFEQMEYTLLIKNNLFIGDNDNILSNTSNLAAYYIRIIPYLILLETLSKINANNDDFLFKLKSFEYILEYRALLVNYLIEDSIKSNFKEVPFLYRELHESIFEKENALIKKIVQNEKDSNPIINNISEYFFHIRGDSDEKNIRKYYDSDTLIKAINSIKNELQNIKQDKIYGIVKENNYYTQSKDKTNNYKYYIHVHTYIYYINLVFIDKWFTTFKNYNEHSLKFKKIRDNIGETTDNNKYSIKSTFISLINTARGTKKVDNDFENKFRETNEVYTNISLLVVGFEEKFSIDRKRNVNSIGKIDVIEPKNEHDIVSKYFQNIKILNEQKKLEIKLCNEFFDLIEIYPQKINKYFETYLLHDDIVNNLNINTLKSNINLNIETIIKILEDLKYDLKYEQKLKGELDEHIVSIETKLVNYNSNIIAYNENLSSLKTKKTTMSNSQYIAEIYTVYLTFDELEDKVKKMRDNLTTEKDGYTKEEKKAQVIYENIINSLKIKRDE
jgi:hypothetical protein